MTTIYGIIFLLIIVVLGLYLAPILKIENFQSQDLSTPGTYPVSVDKPILDSFPLTGNKGVSNRNYSDIWWEYPEFDKSSFTQITNNLRYVNSPEEGTCISADMCNALYKKKKNKSNVVCPLPPVEEGPGARVGYYRTEPNLLFFSIPTNETILY